MTDSDAEYFESRVFRPETPCWNWRSYISKHGYGRWARADKKAYAHRVVYELLVGPIPEGTEIHHKCFNRSCVNPDHLEAVSHVENLAASHGLRTHCKRGHEFTAANTYVNPKGHRQCRTCRDANGRRYREARRVVKPPRTHCPHGHPWIAENIRTTKAGTTVCKVCQRDKAREAKRAKGAKPWAQRRLEQTHCPHGHEYTPENTYEYERDGRTYRYCRECNRAAARRR